MAFPQFVEALSADPVVRALSRQAVRVLTDNALSPDDKSLSIRRIQAKLLEHQRAVARSRASEAKASPAARAPSVGGQADPKQVLARRKEMGLNGETTPQAPQPVVQGRPLVVAAPASRTPRYRPVLSLRRKSSR